MRRSVQWRYEGASEIAGGVRGMGGNQKGAADCYSFGLTFVSRLLHTYTLVFALHLIAFFISAAGDLQDTGCDGFS